MLQAHACIRKHFSLAHYMECKQAFTPRMSHFCVIQNGCWTTSFSCVFSFFFCSWLEKQNANDQSWGGGGYGYFLELHIVKQQCLVYKFECNLCDKGVMLVSHAVIYTIVLKNTKTLLHQFASIFTTIILWLQRILLWTLESQKSARTNLTVLSMRWFLLKNWDLLSMYNLIQFVLRFLISLLLVFSLHVFIVHLHLQNFYPYVHINIFILLFYHSIDNDQSTVETLGFTICFYR